MPEKKVSLVIIGLVMMVMLAACASSGKKPEEKVPGPSTPGPMTDRELPPPRPPEPGVAGPDVTAPPPVKPKPAPEAAYFFHPVKWRGESLSIIARWYTGDIQNWKILKEHNPDINPNRMSEGNKIRIPEYLMKTKAPMPKEYVDSSSSKAAKKERGRPATPPGPSKDNDEEPRLFGPK
jgi:hypothetical protein